MQTALEQITNAACEVLGVDPVAIRGRKRSRPLAWARQLICLLAIECGHRKCQIDAFFGVAHGCAHNNITQARNLCSCYPQLARQAAAIRQKVQAGAFPMAQMEVAA